MLVQFAFTSHWRVLSLHLSRSKKKKRKQYKPLTSYIAYKPRHSTQENNQFCSMLIERRESKIPGGNPLEWPIRGSSARMGNGYLFQPSGVVEVHERVEKSVSFCSVKRPKRANRRILWLWTSRENFLASFVICSQFKGIWKGYYLSIEGTG